MAHKTCLIKMKDGRIGLGYPYKRKGVKLVEVMGPGFFLDAVGPEEIVYAIPSEDIDDLMRAAGRWQWQGEGN